MLLKSFLIYLYLSKIFAYYNYLLLLLDYSYLKIEILAASFFSTDIFLVESFEYRVKNYSSFTSICFPQSKYSCSSRIT